MLIRWGVGNRVFAIRDLREGYRHWTITPQIERVNCGESGYCTIPFVLFTVTTVRYVAVDDVRAGKRLS
jgi:hypothetical protein